MSWYSLLMILSVYLLFIHLLCTFGAGKTTLINFHVNICIDGIHSSLMNPTIWSWVYLRTHTKSDHDLHPDNQILSIIIDYHHIWCNLSVTMIPTGSSLSDNHPHIWLSKPMGYWLSSLSVTYRFIFTSKITAAMAVGNVGKARLNIGQRFLQTPEVGTLTQNPPRQKNRKTHTWMSPEVRING